MELACVTGCDGFLHIYCIGVDIRARITSRYLETRHNPSLVRIAELTRSGNYQSQTLRHVTPVNPRPLLVRFSCHPLAVKRRQNFVWLSGFSPASSAYRL